MGHKGHIMVQEGLKMHEKKQKIAGILGPKTLFFAFFYAFLALFGPLYGLFGPFLTLFNEKTSFLALLGKNFLEKLCGLSVKGGGVPP